MVDPVRKENRTITLETMKKRVSGRGGYVGSKCEVGDVGSK
jgi:hypothetical protein